MSSPLFRANPGDIITATTWNLVVDTLNDALTRIQALESGAVSGNALVITDLVPGGPYRSGDALSVRGRNFQFAAGATRVFLNATLVLSLLPTSSDTRLDFSIPSVPGVLESGTTVDLVVLNQSQTVTRQIVLRPKLSALQGALVVEWVSVNPATVVPGQPATFVYGLLAGTNKGALWSLVGSVDVATNAAAWNAQVRLLDNQGNVLNPAQLALEAGQRANVQVQILSVPASTAGVTFGVTLTGTAEGITGSSGIRQFTVGTPTPPPDLAISLATVPALSQGALVGNTLTVPGGASRPLGISVDLTVAGVYTISRSVLGTGTGWAVNLDSGTTDSFTINPGDLTATGTTQRLLRYAVVATAGATTPAQIQVQVQRQGNASFRALALNTVRA